MCHRTSDGASVPDNRYGKQSPRTGYSYAGLFMIGTGYEQDYREYLHTFLTEELIAGKKYEIEMYVSLAEVSRYAIASFGIYFSEDEVYVDTKETIDDVPVFPHVWTAGDKNPGIVLVFKDLQLITQALTIKACLIRPSPATILDKTLTNTSEQKASLVWAANTDLVAGIGQEMTVFAENISGERTHLFKLLIDVRPKVCP